MRWDALEAVVRLARIQAQAAASTMSDNEVLSVAVLYPEWAPGVPYGGEGQPCIVSRDGVLYRCRTPHTSQADWAPELADALWTRIDKTHAGTLEDPIPAAVNMEYTEGLYYSEAGKLYRCTRSTGQPVAYLPSQLVGQYFEEVAA